VGSVELARHDQARIRAKVQSKPFQLRLAGEELLRHVAHLDGQIHGGARRCLEGARRAEECHHPIAQIAKTGGAVADRDVGKLAHALREERVRDFVAFLLGEAG
jgi:hypothetical protein